MRSKKQLEMALSRVKGFDNSKVSAEQYITPSDIASEVLWKAYMDGEIEGKVIVDLGSGTGILGIGALLLGAKKVYFIDNDPEVLSILKENIRNIESEYRDSENGNDWEWESIDIDVVETSESIIGGESELIPGNVLDTIVTNPPFGTK